MFCFFHSQVHFIGASLHGTHREMAGPRFTSRARTIAGRVKHRPIWSGDPKDWSTFAFMLRAFFEQVGVVPNATARLEE
jgi:negative regulator of sigma E activity